MRYGSQFDQDYSPRYKTEPCHVSWPRARSKTTYVRAYYYTVPTEDFPGYLLVWWHPPTRDCLPIPYMWEMLRGMSCPWNAAERTPLTVPPPERGYKPRHLFGMVDARNSALLPAPQIMLDVLTHEHRCRLAKKRGKAPPLFKPTPNPYASQANRERLAKPAPPAQLPLPNSLSLTLPTEDTFDEPGPTDDPRSTDPFDRLGTQP